MKIRFFIYSFILLFVLAACEQEVTFDLPDGERALVVDGRIEEGSIPYVILTHSTSFYGAIGLDNAEDYFVPDAKVTVSDGEKSVELFELVIDTLGQQGILYLDLFGQMIGEAGKNYQLTIEAEGKTLTSSTHIPHTLPIDSIWWEPQTIGNNDSLARVFLILSDPDTLGNYYRYFTQRNDEPILPGLGSVFDDLLINGLTFPSPIDRAETRLDSINFEYYGFFNLGDEVTVRLSGIDENVYDFWNTLETNTQSGGPFSGITVIKGNVEGGLGVWGGYGVQEASISIPKE